MNKKNIIENLCHQNQVNAFLFYSPQNRYWFSRFQSSLGYVLVTNKENFLFLDGRYITAARESYKLQNIDHIEILDNNFGNRVQQILKKMEIKTLGFESDWVTCQEAQKFKENLSSLTLKAIDTSYLRVNKNDWEIEQITEACNITNQVFESVLKWVKPGITEKELARFVSDSFLKHGAEKLSFDTIVASGKNGSMPHAKPTNKTIEKNELITLDMGCYYQGYASDQTRTFAIGKNIDPKLLEIYQVVYEAQTLGISLVKPGAYCHDIHKAVADFIRKKGYGEYFTHGLGHGLGIEIHEEPYETLTSKSILKPGMVVTVEPGIYIPNFGGVRIEDDFLVTENGNKRLTSGKRELILI